MTRIMHKKAPKKNPNTGKTASAFKIEKKLKGKKITPMAKGEWARDFKKSNVPSVRKAGQTKASPPKSKRGKTAAQMKRTANFLKPMKKKK